MTLGGPHCPLCVPGELHIELLGFPVGPLVLLVRFKVFLLHQLLHFCDHLHLPVCGDLGPLGVFGDLLYVAVILALVPAHLGLLVTLV